MLWRKWARDIAKVGVEGSNPFARSKLSSPNQKVRRYRHLHAERFSVLRPRPNNTDPTRRAATAEAAPTCRRRAHAIGANWQPVGPAGQK